MHYKKYTVKSVANSDTLVIMPFFVYNLRFSLQKFLKFSVFLILKNVVVGSEPQQVILELSDMQMGIK
jgi:hypothetical protein